jgi:hypothetical protein
MVRCLGIERVHRETSGALGASKWCRWSRIDLMRSMKPKRGAITGANKPKPATRGSAWSKASKSRPALHGVSLAGQCVLANGKGARNAEEAERLSGVVKPLNGRLVPATAAG